MIKFILNNNTVTTELSPGITLLDFIRYFQNLKGTKIGCREGDCGACTVLAGEILEGKLCYRSVTSCLMAIGNAHGKHIVTIEGVNFKNELNPIQQAMAEEGATQCGFCTPGFVMSLAGYCLSENQIKAENAIASIDGNICRCTGYKSIEKAALKVNGILAKRQSENPQQFVTEHKILPEYFSTIKERLDLLHSDTNQHLSKSSNEPITFLGGGTDLYVQKHESMIHAEINFLFDQKELNGIFQKGNKCFIGASATVSDLMKSAIIQKYFNQFAKYAKLISSTPIRNIATIAGNFVNASPIGDFTIFFLALDATLILSDNKTKRELPLRDFYKDYKVLNKKPGEFIEQFYFELPNEKTKYNFEKVSKRTHLDIASVNTAIKIIMQGDKIIEAHISAGGVFAYPKYLKNASDFLNGKNITSENILQAIVIAQNEIAPISDARGSAEYKRLLLSQLIKAHFLELFPDKINFAKFLLL